MEPISLIRVFIASPADVPKERTAVEEACNRTNIELGDYLKIRLEAVRWETHTVPSFAGSIQEIIYKQIDFEKLDLFVGILGNTFGTKSSIKDSGTYHEFQKAVELAEKNLTPHIMLYFGDKDLLDPNDVNEQKKKEAVKEFRSTLKERLYRQYKKDEITNRSAEQVFADLFKTHLSMWVTSIAPPQPRRADLPEDFKIIHLTITDFEWYHLLQLVIPDPHPYKFIDSLEREMRTLERMQLIRFKNQNSRWNRLPRHDFMLRDIVELTDFGVRFMEWRRKIPPYTENWGSRRTSPASNNNTNTTYTRE